MRGAEVLDAELRYVTADGSAVVTTLRFADARRLASGRPVRLPASHAGQRHYPGLFWSATTGGHVVYESRLELDRLWLADFDPGVVRIAAQPLWLCGRDGRAVRRHVPDLLLQRADGSIVVVDVKPAQFLDVPEVAAVLAWTGRACQARSWSYEVWTGADPTVLANVRYLGRARRPDVTSPADLAQLRDVDPRGLSWGQVASSVAGRLPRAQIEAAICALLWQGTWSVDLSRPLYSDSVLAVSNQEEP